MLYRMFSFTRCIQNSASIVSMLAAILFHCGVSSYATEDSISFSRDIAPILAESCYQCHGPDESQRESELRLDVKQSVFKVLGSGRSAVVAGDLSKSEIMIRLLTVDKSLKMPPIDSGYSISEPQIQKIKLWIEQGGKWSSHWAFEPLSQTRIPSVKDTVWPKTPIDNFILSKLESRNTKPAIRADSSRLRRRVFTDVAGIIPTAQPTVSFNYERVVDELLSSPRFGEKWGRHWLDVARYADSNGADENHDYPNAFHYRDWVIESINNDLSFDRFVTQQLAGDIVATKKRPEPLAGTGFLAIGIKILAEKDPQKKRMDMIDEQLDTLGQAFLGLTIGCARCHDHKFDPIPTKEYYALAGILHSTEVIDRDLYSAKDAARKTKHDEAVANLRAKIESSKKDLERKIGTAISVTRQAEKFERGNVIVDKTNYGKGIGIIGDPGPQDNFAEYDFDLNKETEFLLQIRYAAKQARPGRILLNGKVAIENAISKTTGSWMPDTQTWFTEGSLRFRPGKNTLRIESKPLMSHIDQIRLIKASKENSIRAFFSEINKLENRLMTLQSTAPVPRKVMAVKDKQPGDISIHRRGSHLSLGDRVARGGLTINGKRDLGKIAGEASGRLELARWLTSKQSSASPIVARVIVNRIWHWYFGQGLVNTPNEFGIRGDQPSHPELLDYLARRLIASNWSTKAIHREILLSSTYQMSSRPDALDIAELDPDNRWLSFHPIKRMSPEVFRDSILRLRNDIDMRIGGKPTQVTSQNPSPEQLNQNQAVYDSSRRRSVYLPIVRSNTYDLFTNFDFPDASATAGKRNETIVPTQSLLLMNGNFVHQSASKIFARLQKEDRLEASEIYQELIGRKPHAAKRKALNEFLGRKPVDEDFILLIHSILMSNDFIFID